MTYVIQTSSTHHPQAGTSSACHPHMHTSSTHHLPVVRTTPHCQRGPELSFTVTGICYLMEFYGKNVEFFHFRIMLMICEIICVNGFLCMSHPDIVHISSVYVHIICILSEHMRIMHICSALVLHMFFPNRQC